MSEATMKERLETIEAGYEFCLAYAAQGRTDDAGSPIRQTLQNMFAALDGLVPLFEAALLRAGSPRAASTRRFLEAVRQDAAVAQGAIGLVLDRAAIGSLLVDNLNASIHLRALLTDLFLIDQAMGAAPLS
jgi:hypothetical protein